MKKLICAICILTLMLTLCVSAYAAPQDFNYIWDYADKLNEIEEDELDKQLESFSSSSGVAMAVITKQNVESSSAEDYAQLFLANNRSMFATADGESGLIFVDDFDNSTYILYRFGNGADYIDDAETQQVYDFLNESYDSDRMLYSYEAFIACVSDYIDSTAAAVQEPDTQVSEVQTTEKYADDYDFSAPDSQGKLITDWAELITDEQEQQLLEKLKLLNKTYGMDVVIHTTNSIGNKSVSDYADDFFDYNGYGVGNERSGVLLVINMNNGNEGNRDCYTSTRGKAIEALTEYAVGNDGYINAHTASILGSGDYYAGLNNYLELIDVFLAQAASGTPFDFDNVYESKSEKTERLLLTEAILLVVALVVAYVITSSMKRNMKTAEIKKEAADYLKPGSLTVTNSAEVFSHRKVTRTPIPKNDSNSSGSGGSNTHTSSSGTTHGGGGSKF